MSVKQKCHSALEDNLRRLILNQYTRISNPSVNNLSLYLLYCSLSVYKIQIFFNCERLYFKIDISQLINFTRYNNCIVWINCFLTCTGTYNECLDLTFTSYNYKNKMENTQLSFKIRANAYHSLQLQLMQHILKILFRNIL